MGVQRDFKIRAIAAGVHFFWRKTGLNVFCDELRIPERFWARAPRFISVALTNKCDLSCAYCYAPKNRASLSFEKLAGWLQELDLNGSLGVGFGGGEPTLYPHLVEICRYTARETRLAVTLTTHGHRVDESLGEALTGNVHFVRVSMDGVGTTYEHLRQRSFTDLKSRLKIVGRIAPFGINFIVNSDTLADLNRAIEIAAEMNAKEFLLLPEQPVHGRGGIDTSTMESLRKWVWSYKGSVPLTITEASADAMPTCSPIPQEAELGAYAHVDAVGTLKRSSYDHHGIQVGPGGIMEALRCLETLGKERKA